MKSWEHIFEPHRTDNKQWKQENQARPCIAKGNTSTKKTLSDIFFNSMELALSIWSYNHLTFLELCAKDSDKVLH